MAQQGYVRTVVAEGLAKHKATEIRNKKRYEYIAKGYAYQTRPAF